MKILASKNNIQIVDSYEVSKYRFDGIIERIKNGFPNHIVALNRSNNSIKKEWAVHNLLYKLGLWRNRTQNLDINYPLSDFEKVIYNIFGHICLIFLP